MSGERECPCHGAMHPDDHSVGVCVCDCECGDWLAERDEWRAEVAAMRRALQSIADSWVNGETTRCAACGCRYGHDHYGGCPFAIAREAVDAYREGRGDE